MIISVVNMAGIPDAEMQRVIRAVNRQIHEDFMPYWSLGATLRLEGRSQAVPDKLGLADMRGDAMLYVWDQVDVPNALGYHDANARGIPYGFVFTQLAVQLGEKWTTTFSHEALELLADPLVNLLVAGPHPKEDRTVFHWYEMSDAVQDETYSLDGVEVSNFVLPLYFTPNAEPGSRNDFLGTLTAGQALPSFGINPGGYIGFFDPVTSKHVTYSMAGDERAHQRLRVKEALTRESEPGGRRAIRIGAWPREQNLADTVLVSSEAPRAAALQARARSTAKSVRAVSSKCNREFEEVRL